VTGAVARDGPMLPPGGRGGRVRTVDREEII